VNITRDTPVGAIVAARLGRARIFERLGIDYCCHGASALSEVCVERSLDIVDVMDEIAASDGRAEDEDFDRVECLAMAAGELTDHIVETHHTYLRCELPRLSALIEKVLAAHGARHPELAGLCDTFNDLREELESHMIKEERVLFPLIKQLEAAHAPFPVHCVTVENPIRVMEHEHRTVGMALARMREFTHDYHPPADGCLSMKALYEGLANLETDLHHHIHKENNILFPRAAELELVLRPVKT
jgi:regulator of cell morphogenesis and NO signaling